MEEPLVQFLQRMGPMVASLVLVYLIVKTPAVQALVERMKKTNGNGNGHGNGVTNQATAGAATIDFWKNEMREIVEDVIKEHEGDTERRHREMLASLKEIKDEQRAGVEKIRDRLHEIATPLTAATISFDRLYEMTTAAVISIQAAVRAVGREGGGA